MDGFVLDNGALVHFSPYAGSKVKPLLQKGERVTVNGIIQAGPNGPVLQATGIKNLMNGKSVNIAAIPPPVTLPPGAATPPG